LVYVGQFTHHVFLSGLDHQAILRGETITVKKVIVIGAGVGGLTTAAILAREGFDVTVLESHIYAGGCAGTFFHQGYRFDAGATLAGGFYPGGPMDLVAQATGISNWEAAPSQAAMVVHLPDGKKVTRWADERRLSEYHQAFGLAGDAFFSWQERTADALWALALKSPFWPPQTVSQFFSLISDGMSWLGEEFKRRFSINLLLDAFRPVATHLKTAPEELRLFIDGQLLISAQTTSAYANALYGASALDLPRRGVVTFDQGMGAISERLAQAVADNGGIVVYRREALGIIFEKGKVVSVVARQGSRGKPDHYPADIVIANLTPWNLAHLMGENAPVRFRKLNEQPEKGWGAFMVYIGVDQRLFPKNFPLHHQVIVDEPFGEGNTIFISLSPENANNRAPNGKRALTISTHTQLKPWWDWKTNNPQHYEIMKQTYVVKILQAAEIAIPGVNQAIDLLMPATPVTFERFTGRAWGWVGGFPQTNLFQAWGPRVRPGVWMVGDSIFPGQSTAAVALGGLRVAKDVLRTHLFSGEKGK
jgi:C-3',4' desaturase CrtD